MGALTLVITGAGGFVGRHAVAAARARGHAVLALVRRETSIPREWQGDTGVKPIVLDLSTTAASVLATHLSGTDAVIHAAAGMGGDDADHARDTTGPTEVLLAALAVLTHGPGSYLPKLVLVSSLSVYDGQALQAGAVLDEDSPLEAHPEARDAYCRAKLAQEQLCRDAARTTTGFDLAVLRPGAVFGPGRLWNGHLGHPMGPALIRVKDPGEVPVCHVTHCATALVLAAEAPADTIDTINVIDADRPDRAEYIEALSKGGWPRLVLTLPWGLLARTGKVLGMFGLGARLPGLLRPAVLHARMKPLRYSTARLEALPGWEQGPGFAELMAAAHAEEAG